MCGCHLLPRKNKKVDLVLLINYLRKRDNNLYANRIKIYV